MNSNSSSMKKSNKKPRKTPRGFVDATERLERLRSDPDRAERVADIRKAGREMDRLHADGLASIRQAAKLTQSSIAGELGIQQGDVSKIERRSDMLLSTLRNYLAATGAHDVRIVLTLEGQNVELDLDEFGVPAATDSRSPMSKAPSTDASG